MGVCIWKCNKDQENIVKDSSIDCYKKTDQSIFANVITSNNINEDKKFANIKYKKLFFNNNSKEKEKEKGNINTNLLIKNPKINYTFSNHATASNTTMNDKYLKSVVKIQNFYRKHTRMKNNKKFEEIKDKDDDISLKLNMEIMETVFSSNSLNNSNISSENINHNNNIDGYNIIENNLDNKEMPSISLPFNIKTKLSNMRYKYSGYIKKKIKINSVDSPKDKTDNSNSCEEKEIFDNEEKKGLIKEGFGKFIFMDGSEFCGIFHNNTLQTYGKYSNINQKNNNNNNNIIKEGEKEIIIADNINYEDFIGVYKNYSPGGFGIYTNLITNLKITGNFDNRGIYGIGIENSDEGGYIYSGEFRNNKKEGLGTIIWKYGCKYQGEFKNNQMNGTGIIEFSGNNYYQGEIKNGKMEGYGIFFWNDKRKYIGNYKNDKRNGFGIYISRANNEPNKNISEVDNDFDLYNSNTFVGFWKNGNMDGFGMKIYNNDIKYGIWENGFRKKYIESNLAIKTYGKLIDKKYNNIFFETKHNIIDFLDDIFNFNINNNNYKESQKEA